MAINIQRYTANSKTLVGQVVPFFLRGQQMLQFLAAICSPLDSVNKAFQTWARNTLIDAATTSQVIVLKWSIKNRLSEYMLDKNAEFEFNTYDRSSYATLYENQSEQQDYPEVKKIYMPENASDTSLGESVDKVIIRNKNEIVSETNEVLIVAPPHNSKISDSQYIKKIMQCIEPYLVYDIEYKITIAKK